jgi:hypothetical protein
MILEFALLRNPQDLNVDLLKRPIPKYLLIIFFTHLWKTITFPSTFDDRRASYNHRLPGIVASRLGTIEPIGGGRNDLRKAGGAWFFSSQEAAFWGMT